MVVDTDDVTTHCWPECEDNPLFNCQGHTCDEHQVPGGCNEGFLRPDAILVVTLISDEDDMYSEGDPDTWKQALLTAKADDEEAIVMLGLLGDTGQPGSG
jgi:hypothetical protein